MRRLAALLLTATALSLLFVGCDASAPVGASKTDPSSPSGDDPTSTSIPDNFSYETTRDVRVDLRAAQGGVPVNVFAPTYDRGEILLLDGETNEKGELRTTLPLPTALDEVIVRRGESGEGTVLPIQGGRVQYTFSSSKMQKAHATNSPDKTVGGNPSCSAFDDHFGGIPNDLVEAKRIEGSELDNLIGNTPKDFSTSFGTITVESVTTKNGGNEIESMTITTDFLARGVIGKGGPSANLYKVDPEGLLNSQEYFAPHTPGGNPAAISHLDVCVKQGTGSGGGGGSNSAPTAQDDSYTTAEDQTLNVSAPGVLSNDSDPDGDPLSVTLVSGPSDGSLSLNADGSFDYTPDQNFNGQDTFDYEISDGNGGTDQATVIITVTPVNDPPTANDDAYSTPQDQTLQVGAPNGVLQNDSDPDQSDNLSASLITGPSNGSLNLGPDGSIIYDPAPGFSGQDTFTYEVSDGNGGTDQATVTITVTSTGSNLVLQCPAESDINSNTGLPNGWPPSNEIGFVGEVRIGDGAGNGAGPATFEYDLSENTSQPDDTGQFDHQDGQTVPFTLTTDGNGNAEFSIGNAADNPLTHTFNFSGHEFDGLMLRARADAGDAVRLENIDLDGSSIGQDLIFTPTAGDATQDFLLLSGPNFANGFTLEADFTLSWDQSVPTNSALAFQIKGFNGPDNPSDFLCGSGGGGNSAPTAQDDSYTTAEDQTLNVSAPGVLSNDSDPDGDPLSVTLVSGPSDGSLSLNADGSFDYTPDQNFNGTDTFDYEISDGNGGTDQATVTITVTPVNDPPTANDDSYSTTQGQTLNVSVPGVLSNDSDPEGDPLSATQIVASPSNGTVTLNPDGSFDYTPNGGFTGTDTFDYEISDGNGGTDQATVTITVNAPSNADPTATDDSYSTSQGQTLTIGAPGVLQNDSDPDGDNLSVTLVSGPNSGASLTLNSDGSFTYTPNGGFTGQDSFVYEAADGNGGTDQAIVTITVTGSGGGGSGNGSVVFVPGQNQTASLAYEDLWPGEGDFDMNDLVIDYNFKITQNPQGDVTEIRARFVTRASGASFLNGFAIQLPTSPSSIASVTGQDLQEGVFSIGGNGTETGTNQAVVPIYDNQYNRIPRSSGSFTANTENDAPFVTPDTIDVTITFASPTSLSGTAPYNPFIVVDGQRGREVHLVDREPTAKADPSFFGQDQDTSDPNSDRFYKNAQNLPWAINIPVSFEYPKEKADIRNTHLKFSPWTESGGAVNQDWYLDKSGFRNTSNMYKRFQ